MSNAGVTRKAAGMTTVTFDAPGLGDRSYLISDGEVGVVVDPQRDPFPYLQEAEKLGVSITAVLETHVHNDYVSGGLALARATGATYAIPAGEPVSFSDEFRALDDGDTARRRAARGHCHRDGRATRLTTSPTWSSSQAARMTKRAETMSCAPVAPCWSTRPARTDLLGLGACRDRSPIRSGVRSGGC